MKKRPQNREAMRRVRLGQIRTLLRQRYGHTLPDDDAGREDLHELLLIVSIGPKDPARRMANIIETWASWMKPCEITAKIDEVLGVPFKERYRKAEDLGRRFNVTNAERDRHRLWSMAAVDVTKDEKIRLRLARRNARQNIRRAKNRRKAGKPNRATWLANAKARSQPWKAEGISRRTWYRRQPQGKSGLAGRGTGCDANKLLNL